MTRNVVVRALLVCVAVMTPLAAVEHPRQDYVVENLGRGVIALRTSDTSVYVGWRLLGTDPQELAFNVYRAAGSEPPVKLNDEPIVATTDLIDGSADLSQTNAYTVRAVWKGVEFAPSAPFLLPAAARPPARTTPTPPTTPVSAISMATAITRLS